MCHTLSKRYPYVKRVAIRNNASNCAECTGKSWKQTDLEEPGHTAIGLGIKVETIEININIK